MFINMVEYEISNNIFEYDFQGQWVSDNTHNRINIDTKQGIVGSSYNNMIAEGDVEKYKYDASNHELHVTEDNPCPCLKPEEYSLQLSTDKKQLTQIFNSEDITDITYHRSLIN